MDTSKLNSRKLWVYIITTVLTITSLIVAAITNNNTLADVSKTFAGGYITISSLYIGGNVAQKIFLKDKDGIKNDSQDIIMR